MGRGGVDLGAGGMWRGSIWGYVISEKKKMEKRKRKKNRRQGGASRWWLGVLGSAVGLCAGGTLWWHDGPQLEAVYWTRWEVEETEKVK